MIPDFHGLYTRLTECSIVFTELPISRNVVFDFRICSQLDDSQYSMTRSNTILRRMAWFDDV